MKPLVDGLTYSAAPPIDRAPRKFIFSSASVVAVLGVAGVVIAGLALPPVASAQRCSDDGAELAFGSNYGVRRYGKTYFDRNTFDQNASSYSVETNVDCEPESQDVPENIPLEDTNDPPTRKKSRDAKPDFNRNIYYANKLEFALDIGWLPINVPFPFDVFEGDPYDLYPLRYTLVPVVASLRWQLGGVRRPLVLRGNWDATFSLSATAIPKGAETHFFSYDMGVRRNFIPRNWHVTPYWDVSAGMGFIDAKGPLGVYYAQGQNFTFTLNMGSGVRYNFNSRYAVSAGLNWMHLSNGNLSAPQYSNYGINVYGPVFGIDIELHKHHRHAGQ